MTSKPALLITIFTFQASLTCYILSWTVSQSETRDFSLGSGSIEAVLFQFLIGNIESQSTANRPHVVTEAEDSLCPSVPHYHSQSYKL